MSAFHKSKKPRNSSGLIRRPDISSPLTQMIGREAARVNGNAEFSAQFGGNQGKAFVTAATGPPVFNDFSATLKLCRFHSQMDESARRAYMSDDLAESATCEFLLDYEEEDDGELTVASPGSLRLGTNQQPGLAPLGSQGRKSKQKKPRRYRWPDDFRDEVLSHLLELNQQRHEEELLQGASKKQAEKSKRMTKRVNDSDQAPQQELF